MSETGLERHHQQGLVLGQDILPSATWEASLYVLYI
jgi:hypothetical protein